MDLQIVGANVTKNLPIPFTSWCFFGLGYIRDTAPSGQEYSLTSEDVAPDVTFITNYVEANIRVNRTKIITTIGNSRTRIRCLIIGF
jgi:hypothetical protein